jgi:hypothetical protein
LAGLHDAADLVRAGRDLELGELRFHDPVSGVERDAGAVQGGDDVLVRARDRSHAGVGGGLVGHEHVAGAAGQVVVAALLGLADEGELVGPDAGAGVGALEEEGAAAGGAQLPHVVDVLRFRGGAAGAALAVLAHVVQAHGGESGALQRQQGVPVEVEPGVGIILGAGDEP